jgi:hypothetical protein
MCFFLSRLSKFSCTCHQGAYNSVQIADSTRENNRPCYGKIRVGKGEIQRHARAKSGQDKANRDQNDKTWASSKNPPRLKLNKPSEDAVSTRG